MEQKLKTLTLILRSLPPMLQTMIVQKLPAQVVEKLATLELSIEEELTEEDWESFYESWPELASMLGNVKQEAKSEEVKNLMITERPKIRDYIAYRTGKSEERPNLPSSICKIVDQTVIKAC